MFFAIATALWVITTAIWCGAAITGRDPLLYIPAAICLAASVANGAAAYLYLSA